MRRILLALALLALADCGGGAAETPGEKCEALRSAICEAWVTCYARLGMTVPRQACVEFWKPSPSCASATGEGANYTQCMEAAQVPKCAYFLAAGGLGFPGYCSTSVPGAAP